MNFNCKNLFEQIDCQTKTKKNTDILIEIEVVHTYILRTVIPQSICPLLFDSAGATWDCLELETKRILLYFLKLAKEPLLSKLKYWVKIDWVNHCWYQHKLRSNVNWVGNLTCTISWNSFLNESGFLFFFILFQKVFSLLKEYHWVTSHSKCWLSLIWAQACSNIQLRCCMGSQN